MKRSTFLSSSSSLFVLDIENESLSFLLSLSFSANLISLLVLPFAFVVRV